MDDSRKKVTVRTLEKMRLNNERIVCLTAYDALTCQLADLAGVDLILVGDSVGNTFLGLSDTTQVTMDHMLHHVSAAARAKPCAFLVADLPFGSYQASPIDAVNHAVALVRAGAEAVKLEGPYFEAVAMIKKTGIPVIGHVGMTPQSVNVFGGHVVQGRDAEAANRLENEVKEIANAGAFGVVLELVPADLAQRITANINTITIGIGAGSSCSGEVQVMTDILGLSERVYKHTRPFMSGRSNVIDAIRAYTSEVRERKFPMEDQSF